MAVGVTPHQIAGALTNFQTAFQGEFSAALQLQPWRNMSAEYTSTSENETYTGLGTVPRMVDVTHDTLQVENLYTFDLTIPNLVWKAAFEVPRSFFEDNKLGQLGPRISQLAQEAARHPGELIFNLPITNTAVGFDGAVLIANTHTIGAAANVDNLQGYSVAAGATGAPTVLEFQNGIAAGRGFMRRFQDDKGRPMNKPGNIIMIPAELESTAYAALNAVLTPLNQPVVPSSATGTFTASGYQVIVNPYMTEQNDFYMIYASGSEAPFIYQTRIAPAFEPLADGSSPAIVNDKFIFTVRARYNVGIGDPRFIVKLVGA